MRNKKTKQNYRHHLQIILYFYKLEVLITERRLLVVPIHLFSRLVATNLLVNFRNTIFFKFYVFRKW